VARLGFALVIAVGLIVARPAPGSAQGGQPCTVSATGVAFGTYDVLASSSLDSTGSISYRCGSSQNVTISISQGSSATYSPREMRNATEVLAYNLFLEAARTTIWGNGSGGTGVFTARAQANRTETATVYGRIAPLQNAAIGLYTDTLVATIVF
jgi:spore coat protein U domain-containing protein, fimbrial subunit CupE1/2/3/6